MSNSYNFKHVLVLMILKEIGTSKLRDKVETVGTL